MQYFRDLMKNIDFLLLLIPLVFAVISVVMIGSTAYEDGFVFSRNMKVQIVAYGIGFLGLTIVLLWDYLLLQSLEKIIDRKSVV